MICFKISLISLVYITFPMFNIFHYIFNNMLQYILVGLRATAFGAQNATVMASFKPDSSYTKY